MDNTKPVAPPRKTPTPNSPSKTPLHKIRLYNMPVLLMVFLFGLFIAGNGVYAQLNNTKLRSEQPSSATPSPSDSPAMDEPQATACAAATATGMSPSVYAKLIEKTKANPATTCDELLLRELVAQYPTEEKQLEYIHSFDALQEKSDDLQRKTAIDMLDSQVRMYLQKTGWYPSVRQLSDDAWLQTNMPTVLEFGAARAPGKTTNSIVGTTDISHDAYSYVATDTLGAECKQEPCAQYKLSVKLSADGSVYGKSSATAQ
jgi:hypothetical protein